MNQPDEFAMGLAEPLTEIRYRCFRNCDLPQLAEIWRSQPPQRGLAQPMSVSLLERLVLAKPYFDREGLIVATSADAKGKLLGFVHAGFGPTESGSGLSTDVGVTSVLMLRAGEADPAVADELLRRSERYLGERGATSLLGGEIRPRDPFYLGLYGGSQQSGVLDSDARTQQFYADHDYQPLERIVVLQRDLNQFRPIIDRNQMQVRRRTTMNIIADAPSRTWWDACTYGYFDRLRFELKVANATVASVSFWDMQPLAAAWGVNALGLVDLEISDVQRRQGLATYLVGESLRHLQAQGLSLVEVHVPETNVATLGLLTKLGFSRVDMASGYRKP